VSKQITESVAESTPTRETLEAFARRGIQKSLQSVLEVSGNGVPRRSEDRKVRDPASR
jgi:hypothetical protein